MGQMWVDRMSDKDSERATTWRTESEETEHEERWQGLETDQADHDKATGLTTFKKLFLATTKKSWHFQDKLSWPSFLCNMLHESDIPPWNQFVSSSLWSYRAGSIHLHLSKILWLHTSKRQTSLFITSIIPQVYRYCLLQNTNVRIRCWTTMVAHLEANHTDSKCQPLWLSSHVTCTWTKCPFMMLFPA